MQEIAPFVDKQIEKINQCLDQLICEHPLRPHHKLFESARYSLLSHGKRLRPLLCIASGMTFGADINALLLPACALEMVHTYSLIHDDLPSMDNDDLRRGKPTLHKVYPEGHAILTGDFLLTYAFEILADAPQLNDQQKLELIRLLARSAGSEGMIGGQVVDLSSEGQMIDFETLKFMHLGKTAALISASLEFGAIIAKTSLEDRQNLTSAGKYLGLAFQIIDDLLDSEEGTTTTSDVKKAKATAIPSIGLEKSKSVAEECFQLATESLHSLSKETPLLIALSKKLVYRDL